MFRYTTVNPAPSTTQATTIFVVFLAVQVLDGVFTYRAVTVYGIGVEANALLAASMHALGPDRALVSAKLLACVCGYILHRTAFHKSLAITAGLYLGLAVIPWFLVLNALFSSH